MACRDTLRAEAFAAVLNGKAMRTLISSDVRGIEYAGVLKNVYAVASGIIHGMKAGDNFLAILVANAAKEMRRFIDREVPAERPTPIRSIWATCW